ncbi:MAG: T9SS type A sorting domain-containing protein [Bacteroidetes bacterium]|nr:T9SS type A sorting domain-containing protein [Bacteroidota bacterium]
MKRCLLFILALSFGLYCIAQNRVIPPKEQREQPSVKIKHTKGLENTPGNFIPGENTKNMMAEEAIGNTWYDCQSNRSMQNRLYYHPDGTFAGVWTRGPEGNPGGSGRGTGYNYFDGNSWGPYPEASVEDTTKTGWPSYAPYGENGEIFACHHMVYGLLYGIRETKGVGDWEGDLQIGPAGAIDISFPRVTTTGPDNNIIHFISTTWVPYNGQATAFVYSRSSDGGQNWEIENQLFDELGPDYCLDVGGDIYEFAEPKDGLLTFLVGDNWIDLNLFKSYDEGDTWDKTTIWECPYPLNSGTPTDTFYCPDGSHHLAIDNEGLVHVVFSLTGAIDDGTGPGYFPGYDGVVYWNENRPAFSNDINALNPDHEDSELVEDYSLIGWSQDVNGNGELDILWEGINEVAYNTGMSSHPQIIIDDLNRIFVLYSSVTETYDNGTSNYRHIWVRSSPNGGEWWGTFFDMHDALIYVINECVFPSAAANSDDNIYFIYQADLIPGYETTATEENLIRFMTVNKEDVLSGITDHKKDISAETVSQNYPNPFSGTSTVYVMLKEPAILSLEVHNLMGQLVYSTPEMNYNSGKVEFTIDGSIMESGIYFYSIISGESSVTKKMIIE